MKISVSQSKATICSKGPFPWEKRHAQIACSNLAVNRNALWLVQRNFVSKRTYQYAPCTHPHEQPQQQVPLCLWEAFENRPELQGLALSSVPRPPAHSFSMGQQSEFVGFALFWVEVEGGDGEHCSVQSTVLRNESACLLTFEFSAPCGCFVLFAVIVADVKQTIISDFVVLVLGALQCAICRLVLLLSAAL